MPLNKCKLCTHPGVLHIYIYIRDALHTHYITDGKSEKELRKKIEIIQVYYISFYTNQVQWIHLFNPYTMHLSHFNQINQLKSLILIKFNHHPRFWLNEWTPLLAWSHNYEYNYAFMSTSLGNDHHRHHHNNHHSYSYSYIKINKL